MKTLEKVSDFVGKYMAAIVIGDCEKKSVNKILL